MNFSGTNSAAELRSEVHRVFGFDIGAEVTMHIYKILLRGEQLVYWVHPITLRMAFSPSLMIGEDVNGDS